MGLGFTGVLVALGASRELLGQGTLLANAHLLLGDWARGLEWSVLGDDYRGLLLAVLPPGAFIGLGLLLALKNVIDARRRRARPAPQPTPSAAGEGAVA